MGAYNTNMYSIYDLSFRDPDLNLAYLLQHTADVWWKAIELKFYDNRISLQQWRLLNVLKYHKGSITPAEISRCLFRKSQTVTSEINDLVEKGYVEKTVDPINKKRVRIQMTESGHRVFQENEDWIAVTRKELSSCFSPDELEQFQDYLKKLRDWILDIIGVDLLEPLDDFQASIK